MCWHASLSICWVARCERRRNVYVHADGRSPQQVVETYASAYQDQGYRYFRVQMGITAASSEAIVKPEGAPDGAYFDPAHICPQTRLI